MGSSAYNDLNKTGLSPSEIQNRLGATNRLKRLGYTADLGTTSSFVDNLPINNAHTAYQSAMPLDGKVYGTSGIDTSNFYDGNVDFTNVAGSSTASNAVKLNNQASPEMSSFNGNTLSNWGDSLFGIDRAGEYMQGKDLNSLTKDQQNQLNSALAYDKMHQGVDFGSAFNVGLSAFDAWNKYNNQKEMMSLYKAQLADARSERDRKNKTREANSSALANAKII